MANGKLIVLDGLDGCGKSTQFELVSKYLSDKIKVHPISFPDYEEPSSALVRMYLSGELSDSPSGVNAYAASCFYAVDRYASYKKYWEKDYKNGDLILASRYVTSNAIHQMTKLPETEWDEYLKWLYDFEYVKFELPKADKVIFLDMPIEVSQKLLSNRYDGDETKKDIHEADLDYLYSCRKAALYAAERLNWIVISCSDGTAPYSREKIFDKIINSVSDII